MVPSGSTRCSKAFAIDSGVIWSWTMLWAATWVRLQPRWVVGIGAFAEGRAREALDGMDLRIGRILHPSPASPAANRGWAEQAEVELRALGVPLKR